MRIAAVIALPMLALTACIPGGGESCPYSEEMDRDMYDWGNAKGHRITDDVEPRTRFTINVPDGESFEEHYSVGDDDITDHLLGYSDGYFKGVINAKFGKANEGTSDYPDVEAHVRGYFAGLMDGFDITAGLSREEKVVFAEGFADAYTDDKDLCD